MSPWQGAHNSATGGDNTCGQQSWSLQFKSLDTSAYHMSVYHNLVLPVFSLSYMLYLSWHLWGSDCQRVCLDPKSKKKKKNWFKYLVIVKMQQK